MCSAPLENMQVLGPASVDAGKLAVFAAAALQAPSAAIVSAGATEISMPLSNMTTGGLWRIKGTAATATAAAATNRHFSIVVKLLQSPLLWAGISQVPESFRGPLERGYPWRTEVSVYTSELAQVLPAGCRLPRVYGIEELDPKRAAIWMEDLAECTGPGWNDERFRHAANLLGRLAGSKAIQTLGATLEAAGDADRLRLFVESACTLVFIPRLMGEDLWSIPAVAEAASPRLIQGLRTLAGRAHSLVDQIPALPAVAAHGDASPQNLLVESRDSGPGGSTGFAVIDWGMFGLACAGYDLGQLLAGRVNEGTMQGRELYRLEPLCLRAYCEGLADSGTEVPESVVRRGHALSMALLSGLTAAASPRVDEPDSEELHSHMAGRLEMAEFVLDLLASTE